MIIDSHAHLWIEDWLPEAFLNGMAQRVCTVRKRTRGEDLTVETVKNTMFPAYWDKDGSVLIQEMDEAGMAEVRVKQVFCGDNENEYEFNGNNLLG